MSNTQTSGFFVDEESRKNGSQQSVDPRESNSLDVFSAAIFDSSFEIATLVPEIEIDQKEEQQPNIDATAAESLAQNVAAQDSSAELAAAVASLKKACEHILSILPRCDVAVRTQGGVATPLSVVPQSTEKVFSVLSSAAISPTFTPTEKIVEGIFDGNSMKGNDGKMYTIPPNYASKSKLVEGDGMKLTITPSGSFIFKQIHPVERARVMGRLEQDATTREYGVRTPDHRWHVLTASVTYYKGVVGDEVVILVPQGVHKSTWGAVENIIKKY